MVYPYNEIWFSNKKEWNTDTNCNMEEPWKLYAKLKTAVAEDHICYGSIYRNV